MEKELFFKDKHVDYLVKNSCDEDFIDNLLGTTLKLSGVYWSLCALSVLQELHQLKIETVIEFVKSCQNEDGGFGPYPSFKSHLYHTLSGIQIIKLLGIESQFSFDKTVKYISSLQRDNGSFVGDEYGELDTRFALCGIGSLYLLNSLNSINTEKAIDYILSCMNDDGGFSAVPGSESHAANTYCCIGSLFLLEKLEQMNFDKIGWWLCERQVENGGLNGRPEKKPDVCYSWWVLASLYMINRHTWIDQASLKEFIFKCQDDQIGGIADEPMNEPDFFHTLFGLAGLSLIDNASFQLCKVNPALCMPISLVPLLYLLFNQYFIIMLNYNVQ